MEEKLMEINVFKIKERKPIAKYKISIVDEILISMWNKGLPGQKGKVIELMDMKEYFNPIPIDKLELLDIDGEVNFKFQIKGFGRDWFYLNLTKKEQIELGLIEKPKRFRKKLIDFSVNNFWVWIIRVAALATILGLFLMWYQFRTNTKLEPPNKSKEKHIYQTESKTNSTDSINISKTDSLTKN